jgi:3-oxo-5-alpha-steroid 4-dehydrogenase 1
MTSLVLLQFLVCPLVLIALLYITAPYGRHFSSGWGPVLPNRLAWFLMELPALLVIGIVLVTSHQALTAAILIPWFMWTVHYAYRTFIFPALMRPSGKNFPALLVLFALVFNTLNGYNNGLALLASSAAGEHLPSGHFVFGVSLFAAGFWLHFSSDRLIRNLRKDGFTGYRIPCGTWFDRVSNPNYLGEILQWVGWAILTWTWAGLAFALFTACNLAPRAVANHRWYRQTFPDYPRGRKILFPGLF